MNNIILQFRCDLMLNCFLTFSQKLKTSQGCKKNPCTVSSPVAAQSFSSLAGVETLVQIKLSVFRQCSAYSVVHQWMKGLAQLYIYLDE